MADFVQVMSQFMRLCDSYKHCDDCPVRQAGFSCDCDHQGYSKTGAEEIEHIIMDWSEEHPEPVYPTWGEWLESEGICFSRLKNYNRVAGMSIPQVFEYQIDGETAFICGDKVNSPIPADIAEKLGLQPKEDA